MRHGLSSQGAYTQLSAEIQEELIHHATLGGTQRDPHMPRGAQGRPGKGVLELSLKVVVRNCATG